MTAGRPHNNKTPLWRNKAAMKVRAYRWMERENATRSGCAKVMGISRHTAIKWWNRMAWSEEDYKAFTAVRHSECIVDEKAFTRCAEELGLSLDCVLLNVATYHEIFPKHLL